MKISRRSLELLIDLVEIKLHAMEVFDRDDRRTQRDLEACLGELSDLNPRRERGAGEFAEALA